MRRPRPATPAHPELTVRTACCTLFAPPASTMMRNYAGHVVGVRNGSAAPACCVRPLPASASAARNTDANGAGSRSASSAGSQRPLMVPAGGAAVEATNWHLPPVAEGRDEPRRSGLDSMDDSTGPTGRLWPRGTLTALVLGGGEADSRRLEEEGGQGGSGAQQQCAGCMVCVRHQGTAWRPPLVHNP